MPKQPSKWTVKYTPDGVTVLQMTVLAHSQSQAHLEALYKLPAEYSVGSSIASIIDVSPLVQDAEGLPGHPTA